AAVHRSPWHSAAIGFSPATDTIGWALFDPTVWTGRALQAESAEWERLVLLFCIRPFRGADRSWPLWISARIRSHSRIGPRRPVGSPDHGCDGETVSHLLKIQLADLGGYLSFSSRP